MYLSNLTCKSVYFTGVSEFTSEDHSKTKSMMQQHFAKIQMRPNETN